MVFKRYEERRLLKAATFLNSAEKINMIIYTKWTDPEDLTSLDTAFLGLSQVCI